MFSLELSKNIGEGFYCQFSLLNLSKNILSVVTACRMSDWAFLLFLLCPLRIGPYWNRYSHSVTISNSTGLWSDSWHLAAVTDCDTNVILQVVPVSYLRFSTSPVLHTNTKENLKAFPLGTVLTFTVHFHASTGEALHSSNSHLTFTTNRWETKQPIGSLAILIKLQAVWFSDRSMTKKKRKIYFSVSVIPQAWKAIILLFWALFIEGKKARPHFEYSFCASSPSLTWANVYNYFKYSKPSHVNPQPS